MKLTNFPKAVFCLTLLLCWGSCASPAQAQTDFFDIRICIDLQTVEVHTPRDSYDAVFQSEVRVFPNRTATGSLMLIPTDDRPSGGIQVGLLDGSVRFHRDGTVARVLLRGRTPEGYPIVVMITPAATEDCLIYTTIGTEVWATWEAQGHIVVNRR